MSVQMIELICFAAVAFLIISKLLATLGTTSDNDPAKKKSFFGEPGRVIDVTNTSKPTNSNVVEGNFGPKRPPKSFDKDLKPLIVAGEDGEAIIKGLLDVGMRLPNFSVVKFLSASKMAFKMILNAGAAFEEEELKSLVDKRYLEQFKNILSSYGQIDKFNNLEAKIAESYMFGNNAFIKVLFTGSDVTTKIKGLHEEWMFSRSCLSDDNNWYLTNVDRPQ